METLIVNIPRQELRRRNSSRIMSRGRCKEPINLHGKSWIVTGYIRKGDRVIVFHLRRVIDIEDSTDGVGTIYMFGSQRLMLGNERINVICKPNPQLSLTFETRLSEPAPCPDCGASVLYLKTMEGTRIRVEPEPATAGGLFWDAATGEKRGFGPGEAGGYAGHGTNCIPKFQG